MKLISFGEVLWDIYPDGKCIGGAPFNFAAHAARLGEEAYLLSAVGMDPLADETLAAVRAAGVHTDYISRSKRKTGQCHVSLDANRVPTYKLLKRVAYDDITVPLSIPADSVLYFGTLALREKHNIAALISLMEREKFSEVFVDLNIRPPFSSDMVITFAISRATILKVSAEELSNVSTALAKTEEHLVELGEIPPYDTWAHALPAFFPRLKLILVTLGADGAYLYDVKNDREYRTPAVPTEVVSTVGAGDSFAAAFLSRYLPTRDAAPALAFAARVAAFVVSKKEAVPPYTLSDF